MGKTHFSGLSIGSDGIEMTSTGTLTLPSIDSAPSSPAVGDMYYNSTTGKVMVYQATGWTSVDGTAAASLDAAYNGGATIAVDSGAITLTDSQTATGGGLLITKSGVVTGANSASVFHINSTGAHDTSGALKMLEISVGSETVSGGVYGLEVDMNAHADHALYATQGSVTVYDGDFTVTACGASTANGFTVTTANTSGDGVIFNLDSITSGDAFVINCTTDAVAYLSIQTDDTAIWSINGTDVLQTVPLEINSDDANALLVEEADGTTDVFAVDASAGAGDTTVTITGAAETITGKNLNIVSSVTTGNSMEINADAVTTGNALLISVASGTMTAAGAAISVIDSTNSDREVFAVRDDGSVYMYGTAEGTTATQTVAGDVVISDGDLTLTGGNVSFTDEITTAGIGTAITSTATTAGAGAGTAGPLVITANSLTTGTALAVRCDAITTGDMLYLDAGGATMTAGSGFFINCNDDNASKFTVSSDGRTVITGTAAGTSALTLTAGDLTVTDTDTTTITSVDGTGNIVEIISGGAIGAGKGVLEIDAAGTWNATGTGLLISIDGITATNSPYAMRINAAGKDAGGFYIDADGATDSVCHIHGGGAVANNMALLELTWDGTPANAGSNMLRVDGSGGTNTAKPVLVEIYDDSISVGLSVNTASAEDMVSLTGGGATGAAKSVLDITWGAVEPHATGSLLRLDSTGITATNNPYAMQIVGTGKDTGAIYADCDGATDSVVHFHSGGNIGNDQAVLEVTADGTAIVAG